MNDSKKELTFERVVDAPRELVFKAWTDPKQVEQWWGPQGVFIPVCELDTKPGGRLHIVMEAGEEMGTFKGTQWPMEGTYVEVDEPNKIVFNSNASNNGAVLFEHQTTVTFEEDPTDTAKTRMTVHVAITKAMAGSEFAISGMEQGWNSQFDKLATFLQKQTGGDHS